MLLVRLNSCSFVAANAHQGIPGQTLHNADYLLQSDSARAWRIRYTNSVTNSSKDLGNRTKIAGREREYTAAHIWPYTADVVGVQAQMGKDIAERYEQLNGNLHKLESPIMQMEDWITIMNDSLKCELLIYSHNSQKRRGEKSSGACRRTCYQDRANGSWKAPSL